VPFSEGRSETLSAAMLPGVPRHVGHAGGFERFYPVRPAEPNPDTVRDSNLSGGIFFHESFKLWGVVHGVTLRRIDIADKYDLRLPFHIQFRKLPSRPISVVRVPRVVKALHSGVMSKVEKCYCEGDCENRQGGFEISGTHVRDNSLYHASTRCRHLVFNLSEKELTTPGISVGGRWEPSL
jgi:hypothetical protein